MFLKDPDLLKTAERTENFTETSYDFLIYLDSNAFSDNPPQKIKIKKKTKVEKRFNHGTFKWNQLNHLKIRFFF